MKFNTSRIMLNEKMYLNEMHEMITIALKRWRSVPERPLIYRISLWTDPPAIGSAINIETRRNSAKFVRQKIAWAQRELKKLLEEGDVEMADLFFPDLAITRTTNPADFEYPAIAEATHGSFGAAWGSDNECWKVLSPLLDKVATEVTSLFLSTDTGLEPDADISVNSADSWCSRPKLVCRI